MTNHRTYNDGHQRCENQLPDVVSSCSDKHVLICQYKSRNVRHKYRKQTYASLDGKII